MQLTEDDARLCAGVTGSSLFQNGKNIGVAVSGGGDSMALLALLAGLAPGAGVTLYAATVDHGLRPEAAAEATFVAETCGGLGIAHETLRWRGWDGAGNLQAAARAARQGLLAGWAQGLGLDAVALGHTRDDQAETFLMRLARGSGVDGLSGMGATVRRGGVTFWRPLLDVARADLRAVLVRQGIGWRDDPSNEDARFDRVTARRVLAALAPLGIGAERLAETAAHLRRARDALEQQTEALARAVARVEAGDVVIDRAGFAAAPEEVQFRLLAHAIGWISGAPYRPRFNALEAVRNAFLQGQAATLQGCMIRPEGTGARICREYAAVKDLVAAPGALWDGRWRLCGAARGEVRALGEGLSLCPDWRETGLGRESLRASPSLWRGETLLAAPLAGFHATQAGLSAEFAPPRGDFFTSILSH